MNSIVDLTGSHVLTEREIWEASENALASIYPPARQVILGRMSAGFAFFAASVDRGLMPEAAMPAVDADEWGSVMAYYMDAAKAGVLAAQGRKDNALLIAVLAHEAAVQRLQAEPVLDSEEDAAARADAQAGKDAATAEVLALYELRHPVEVLPDAAQITTGEA